MFVQGGLREPHLRQAYDRAMDGLASKLLHASSPSKLAYVADWEVEKIAQRGLLSCGVWPHCCGVRCARRKE